MASIPVTMINEVMNASTSEKNHLYVGLCGTQFVGSDRYAVVITEIISPKCVRVANMLDVDYTSNRPRDEYGNEFIYNMSGYVRVNEERTKIEARGKLFKLRKNGRWIQDGDSLWSTGAVHFGEAEEYRDPSF